MPTILKVKYAVLVYQAGIANVFQLQSTDTQPETRKAERLLQSDFRSCEMYARGLKDAGTAVTTMQCNRAGDVQDAAWNADLDAAPFSDKFHPVFASHV
jgi:hypothetical protein